MKSLQKRKRSKPSSGQLSLIGDVYDYNLKYIPHKVVSEDGQAVCVLRLPPDASDFDRRASLQALKVLSGQTESDFRKKEFWRKRARDAYRRKQIVENSTT